MKHTIKDIQRKYEMRKAMNTLSNNDIDRLISFIGTPGIKQFIYNNPLMKATYGVPFIRLYNMFKH